jgi:hypothetical protein
LANQIFNKGKDSTYTGNITIQVPALYVDLVYELCNVNAYFDSSDTHQGVLSMQASNQVAVTNNNGVTDTGFVSSLRLILVLGLFSFADFFSVDRLEQRTRFCLRLVRFGAMVMREWDLR